LFRRSSPEVPDERALAARDAATQAFLALDDEQRATAADVDAADELGTGRRLARAWAQVALLGDEATTAYLAATTDTPPGRGTRAADERATAEIERAREAIRRFRASHARTLDEAALVRGGLPRAVLAARTELTSARAEVAAAAVPSRRAAEALAEAERAAARLDSPGLRERRDAATRTTELARTARTLAADAPRTAERVRTSFSSLATRRAAAGTRTERIEPALSALRREFSEPCSRDLQDAASRAGAELVAADAALARARTLADAGDWDGAADAVADVRAALGRAEARADAVTGRLTELREVKADPSRLAADTRFVLRDAQRLVVDRDLVARHGPVLDAQAVRLQNAVARLEGVHPDYWLYVSELRGVQQRVRQVVEEVRAAA
jgi:chromosome segregation ATPase